MATDGHCQVKSSGVQQQPAKADERIKKQKKRWVRETITGDSKPRAINKYPPSRGSFRVLANKLRLVEG